MMILAQQKRNTLYFSTLGLVLMAAAVTAISVEDSSGTGLRAGMVMMTAGAALLLPWQAAIPAAIAIWLGPNYVRSVLNDDALFSSHMLLELPGLLGVAVFSVLIQKIVRLFEAEDAENAGMDTATGIYEERALRPALEAELIRSRRFERSFALVLVGIDERHQRYAFRDEGEWQASFLATAQLLRKTRTNIDRVYRYGQDAFALILPESADKEVTGLVRRLRKIATNAKPREGEPGGPLPVAFGATFFPQAASTVDDMIRRAEIALKVAGKNSNRLQLDGAEIPALAPPETLRQESSEEFSATDPWADHLAAVDELVTPLTLVQNGSQAETMPHPSAAALGTAPTGDQLPDEELTQLLSRLDETLGMIKGLRAQAS